MRLAALLVLSGLAALAPCIACGSSYSSASPADGGSEEGGGGPGPEVEAGSEASAPFPSCPAQRLVNITGGNGGFGWFTLLWPLPSVIENFNAQYAFDDTSKVTDVGNAATAFYTREVGTTPMWSVGAGKQPHMTAFVGGSNQAHIQAPSLTYLSNGGARDGFVATAAAAQRGLEAPMPVLIFRESSDAFNYPTAPDAPAAEVVGTINQAFDALKIRTTISPALEAELRPDPMKLAQWVDGGTSADLIRLAEKLLFAANLFRHGLVATVVLNELNDDPHGAFNDVPMTTARADRLALILDGFYKELATSNELKCGHKTAPLSLADNVVLLVNGDTPRDSFDRTAWPDGSPLNSSFFYLRSNGWLPTRWFGSVEASAVSFFDPATGNPVPQPGGGTPSTRSEARNLGLAAALYAITRGDKATALQKSENVTTIDGLVANPAP